MRSRTSDDSEILAMKAAGKTNAEICEHFGIDGTELRERLTDAAADFRRRLADVAEGRALLADARIEWMLEKLTAMIASDSVFDDRKWKVAILLLDRQAKLFGLDKAKESSVDLSLKSFDGVPEAKLKEYATDLGLNLPETFSGG